MPLNPGTRLGPYEIVAPIGAGGMGEVYRARDTRLDRDVAVKVLPTGRIGDADAEARFKREARAVGALNHPNICALYDVGLDGSSHHFLVMELLEGQTLQERLTRGPFEIQELLRHAIALADALETAHARGVLHRDLKPANVFLTSRGTPKLVDFGLAKALDPASDMTRAADGLTSAGMAVGTMGYMSPEQLRAESIDARSDLFSFGVVLYEMATGLRAFPGATGAAVAAGILTTRPESPETMRPDLPPALGAIIMKALEKDRERRFQSAAELHTALRQVAASETTSQYVASGAGRTAPEKSRRVSPAVTIGIVAVAGFLIAGGIWKASLRRSSAPPAATRALTIEPLTFTGNARDGALSPDGKFVAYVQVNGAESSVWVRQLATQSDVQIVPPVAGRRFVGLSVTPDGNYVDFVVDGPRDLWRVAFLGGTPRLIASDVWSATGWSADGKHFAFVRADGTGASDSVMIADADGSNQRELATRRTPQRFLSDSRSDSPIARPSWSADGATLLVLGFSAPAGATYSQELITLDTATGAARKTLPLPGAEAVEAAWVDATHAVINHSEGAREPQLSLCDLTTGSLSPVTQHLTAFRGVSLTADRLAAVSTRLDQRSSIWIGGASGGSMAEAVPESPAVRGNVFVDNQNGIVYEMATAAGSGIYARTPRAGQPTLVVNDGSPIALTSDGRIVVFRRDFAIWKVNVDGSGLASLAGGIGAAQPVLMRDDKTVLFLSNNSGLQSLWTAALDGGPARELAHRFAARPAVSFDGRHLLFVSKNATGQFVTVLCDLPDCTNLRETANFTGAWTPDGRSIAYVDPADPKNIYLQPVGGGASRRLTQFTEKNILDFDWSADGKRLAITRSATLADMVLIRGFR